MINVEKHLDFFNPIDVKDPVHIIGLGAIGSHVAEMMVRLGVTNLRLYDFDTVESKNMANQMFRKKDIGYSKINGIWDQLMELDPAIADTAKAFDKGWLGQVLTGHVFLCVDNIDLRRQIVESNLDNDRVKSMYDFRMRLSDAQHYAAAWDDEKAKKAFYGSMQFTHDEAKDATPVSACGTTLSVLPTVRMITSVGVANFINYIKGKSLKKMILLDAFDFETDAV